MHYCLGLDKLRKIGNATNCAHQLFLAIAIMVSVSGCTRHFFRLGADKEVNEVLSEKDKYPEWRIEQYHIYPDPRARFADPTDPDHPPMPPDDPAAWALAPHPQKPGKEGVAIVEGKGYLDLLAVFDAENRVPPSATVEGDGKHATEEAHKKDHQPEMLPAPKNANSGHKAFLIKPEQAVTFGLINSREYQDQRESLYLAALPVTLQRYAFAAQFFALEQAIREATGRDTPEGQHNRWRSNSTVGVTKLFSTGALLLVQFANTTVVELTGPLRGTTSQSIFSLDFIQPLLRGGGKAVTLEPLTQSERSLLYAIRNYARFREQFYVAIVGGNLSLLSGGGGAGIQGAAAITTGGGALSTNSGVLGVGGGTSGVFPGIISPSGGNIGHPIITPGGSGMLDLGTAAASTIQGYYPTLLVAASLQDRRRNVTQLEDILQRFEALKEGGDYSQLQVDQVETQLLQGRNDVLQREQNLRQNLDQFNIQLGLPPDIPLELDESPVQPLTRQLKRLEDIIEQYKAAQDQVATYDKPSQTSDLRRLLHELFASAAIVQDTSFRTHLPERWSDWQATTSKEVASRFQQLGAEQRQLLDKKTELEQKHQSFSKPDQARIAELDFEINLGTLEKELRVYESQPWRGLPNAERQRRQQITLFRDVANSFALVLAAARSERLAKVRESWPSLPSVCLGNKDLLKADPDEAQASVTQVALTNRFDLLNQRAQLADDWRQFRVFANALLGTVNVEYHLDSFTPPGQVLPFDFGGSGNRNQLIINAQPPLVRKGERNNYRSCLIAYQRQRRAVMALEDQISATVRLDIRQLRQLAESYTIQKRSVELAYLTLENALDTLYAPLPPSPAGQGAVNTAANAAALTNQLLTAQSNLPNVQDQLYTFWFNYLTARMILYRDLDLLLLDKRGVWVDDNATCNYNTNSLERTAESGQ